MDGRSLEANPNPSWMGYAVGHWDGETLVVESLGYNDRTWLAEHVARLALNQAAARASAS